MSAQNQAAMLTEKQGRPFKINDLAIPEPGPDEIVIRTRAVAINPVDAMIQAVGMIVTNFPAILGCDGAGEVYKVGSAVTKFKPGDRVVGSVDSQADLSTFDYGTFQQYYRTKQVKAAKIPDNVTFAEAAVIPLGLMTAAGGLFEKTALGLDLPQAGGKTKPNEKVVTIWAASTSVGSCAVQLARAAGYEVVATASPHNHEYCRALGAQHVFDYSSDTVSDDIVAAHNGKESAGIFDARFEGITTCAHLVKRLGGKQMVSTVLAPGMPLPDDMPEGVEAPADAGIVDQHIMEAVWGTWLPAALADGSMKCKPDPKIVGKGLEAIQDACDLMLKGVSASKLVVEV